MNTKDERGIWDTMDSMVYIDESGDLGCGTGTRWFIISAVIVDKENEKKIR